MKKKYYVSGIYFNKSVEDLTEWFLTCQKLNLVVGDKTLLRKFRRHRDNYDRAKFISMLVDEELEVLMSLVNVQEYYCIVNIIKRLEVSDYKSYVDRIFEKMFKPKKKVIEKEAEVLVNNRLVKVKVLREAVSFE